VAYSPQQLREIRQAERAHVENSLQTLALVLRLRIIFEHNDTPMDTQDKRVHWILHNAKIALDGWRALFAPSRVGLPIESEWEES
jgi:hypothetical protein